MMNLVRPVGGALTLLLMALITDPVLSQQQPVTNADVLEMVKAKISTGLIVKTIETARAVDFDLQPRTIVALKQAGVDDRVIEAMLKAANAGRTQPGGQSAAAPASSSYGDGYQLGWMYGDQFRRSGERYNPNDIVLPGSLIHDMTVKLGAIEYEKWEKGYLKGYEDGRLGRPRAPAGNTTVQPRDTARNDLSALTKSQIAAARTTHGGAPVFGVFHDHAAGSGVCEGYLVVLKNRLMFQGNDVRGFQAHQLDVGSSEIQEVKRNRLPTYGIATFHVKLKDGRNFNFLTPNDPIDDVVAKIASATSE